MTRKFNIGRQSDIALNKEMHDLLMSLRYINNGADEPVQDLQTPIPTGSIWNDINRGKNILKVNTTYNGWEPMFTGYYHPVDLFTKPLNPMHGQLWIDGSKDNTLHFYDENTNAWIAVRAAQTNSNQILVDMHTNFMHMFPLKDMDSISEVNTQSFLVPHEGYGKLTDNGLFIHPSSDKYEVISDVGVKFKSTSDMASWVHANPHKMFTMEKKLVKVESDYIHGLFDNNTEFFYLDTDGWKHMLPYDYTTSRGDFKPFDKGIELVSDRAKASEFIMMYAYSFYDTVRPGKLIRKDFNVGSKAEIHVGLSTKHPMVFVDGLYLEQHKYDYDKVTGNITIHDDIINPMDIMSLVFENNETVDFEINQTIGDTKDALVGTLKEEYTTPIVFVSGVMGAQFFNPEQIEYNKANKTVTIKNWGPHQPNDISYAMVVEADDSYVCHGHFDDTKTIYNDNILGDYEDYMVWADGVLVSSKHLDIMPGAIKINNAIAGVEYLLLKINDASKTALLFDGKAMNYTIAIQNEDGSLYNECNNACVFVDGKALMMKDTVEKENLPVKGAQGQIVKIRNSETSNEVYTYYIYNDFIAKWETLSQTEIDKVEDLIKADYSSGSIMVDAPQGAVLGTYYAYTYANGVEEPLLKGKRALLEDKTEYAVNVQHKFNNGQGALTVFTNKLYNHDATEEPSNTGKFIVPELEATNTMFKPYAGELLYYVERPEKTESASCIKEVLTAANRNTQYQNGYTTSISLMPGVVSVYLNGVRLERNDFTIIDDHTIMLHINVVGGQRNYDPNNQDTWNKYLFYNSNGEHEISSLRDDIIVIEVRQDFNIKTQTVPVRYPGQRIFFVEDDGIPKSLILTQDLIKIFINGVIYDGEYIINKENGSITLLDSELESMLNVDPIARFFETHPVEYDEYIQEHGKPYTAKKQTDKITFEWR